MSNQADQNTNWAHFNPVKIVSVPLEQLEAHSSGEHVLLVTTQGFVERGVVDQIKDILKPRIVSVWSGVRPNPDITDLDAATQQLKVLRVDSVVALGGGSAIDAAKTLATTLANVRAPSLVDVFRRGVTANWISRLPLVAIPTTSGTGSEVTPFATIWDHTEHRKHSLAGDFVFPDLALLDATLTLSLGEDDTLYPALDAISHALESLWNKNCTPVSRAFAFQALELSAASLPAIRNDLTDLKARQDLLIASTLAGAAISQTKTAIAHAMSYPLTTQFNVPHGLACSFTLEFILIKNLDRIAEGNESKKKILLEILNVLNSNELGKMMRRYATKNEVLKLENEMNQQGRSDNYNGLELDMINDVLNPSLE